MIERKLCARMFNLRREGFYKADIVVLVAVRSPREYRCIVLTVEVDIATGDMDDDKMIRPGVLRTPV
jgi:hypothetical protein